MIDNTIAICYNLDSTGIPKAKPIKRLQMSINTKSAKECLTIIFQAFEGDKNQAVVMLESLAKVKSNQSFHNSTRLLADLAKHQLNKETQE